MTSRSDDQQALELARAAKDQLQKALASRDDVRGIGITRVGTSYGVKVNLADSADRDSVPDTVLGVRVLVDVVGVIQKR